MGVVEDLADELARSALEAEEELGDANIVDEVSGVLLAQSQTLQEAYMTAIRVRRSANAGRRFLDAKLRAHRRGEAAPPPPTADNPDIH
ncbi:hypothetical protein [Wenxinia saemankumensis]|uniref:Uncharacterized protein n=1 Tax=Wenxinia saemankumensis TaxID=1447782 RepID=A0A1M6H2W5_9RHOB|nr:hypothetical protein [Wenxinia saemankumensis]SHJ16540.1 hypothetical protein SAMN05444417_3076 [Wenxinia saemankumensis]